MARNMLAPLVFLVLGATMATAQAQPGAAGIIDTHAHLGPDTDQTFDDALAAAIALMDRFGIETTIVMSPPRPRDVAGGYESDDFAEALRRYPGRFRFLSGGGSLNPMLHGAPEPSEVTAALREAFAAEARRLIGAGAAGFGEMSSLHVSLAERHGYSFAPADHPLLLLLADIAAEHDLPIDLHLDASMTERATPENLARFPNNPARLPATIPGLERLLAHNRRARIIWAHAGTDHIGDFAPDLIGALLDRHGNLFVSLKISGPRAPVENKVFAGKTLGRAWRDLLIRHADRFVIGTDTVYAGPAAKGPLAEFARSAEPRMKAMKLFLSTLPAEVRRQIARENARRLYRLSIRGPPVPGRSRHPAQQRLRATPGADSFTEWPESAPRRSAATPAR